MIPGHTLNQTFFFLTNISQQLYSSGHVILIVLPGVHFAATLSYICVIRKLLSQKSDVLCVAFSLHAKSFPNW